MEIERIDFLLPLSSQYGALHYFTQKIYEAALRLGFECRLLAQEDHFIVPVEDPPDLTFAINGAPKDAEGVFLCDRIRVPHMSFLVDPPFRFLELLRSPYMLIACDDRDNCAMLRANGFGRTYFFPYGVEPELLPPRDDERPYDVVMIASYIDYRAYRESWMEKYPRVVVEALEEAAEITIQKLPLPFTQAFLQALNSRDLAGEQIDLVRALIDLELYLKGWDRTQMVRAVKDAKVHLIGGQGTGWEKELEGMGNVHFYPMVPYEETLEIMKQSKLVLSSSIKNKQGASERVFSALAVGAVPLSTETEYLKESFVDQENILFCQPDRYDLVNDQVNALLRDEEKRKQIARRGRAIVMAHHTWDHHLNNIFLQR